LRLCLLLGLDPNVDHRIQRGLLLDRILGQFPRLDPKLVEGVIGVIPFAIALLD